MTTSRPADIADPSTLDRARGGDTDALADLWTIYQPQLLRLLRTHGRSAAEDITSQVWIDVRRALAGFDGDGDSFRRWIFTIAGRRAIDESRRASRRWEVPSESLVPLVDRARAIDPLDVSMDNVMALLSTLQPVAAEVVMLRVVQELPVAEVAAITGESESNVRVIAHRALDRLRRSLETAAGPGAAPAFGLHPA